MPQIVNDFNLRVVYTINSITVENNQVLSGPHEVDYEPSAVSILNDEEFAVGESSDGNVTVHIYRVSDGMEEIKTISLEGQDAVTDLEYSTDGLYLVISDHDHEVATLLVRNDYRNSLIAAGAICAAIKWDIFGLNDYGTSNHQSSPA